MALRVLPAVLIIVIACNTFLAPYSIWGSKAEPRKLCIGALAVGNGRGEVVYFNIWVAPGTGRLVLVGKQSLVASDVIASLNFSTWMAARLAMVDHNLFDYYIEYNGDVPIKGLSATLLFTLGFLTLLRGDEWDGLATATGLIVPSGIVGNVSGVKLKYQAAIESGYNRVLAPVWPSLVGSPGFTPVVSIVDSYGNFTLSPLFPRYNRYLEELLLNRSRGTMDRVFYQAWSYFYHRALEITSNIDGGRAALIGMARDYDEGMRSINESAEYALKGLYYTAASRAFYGYWLINAVNIALHYVETGDISGVISRYKDDLDDLNRTLGSIAGKNEYTLLDLDVLINTYERLFDSIESFNRAYAIVSRGSINNVELAYMARNLSYALARLDTARQWLDIIGSQQPGELEHAPTIDPNRLKLVVENEHGLLESFASFLEALNVSGIRDFVGNRLNEFRWARESYVGCLALYLWIQRDLSNFILSFPAYTILSSLVRDGIRMSVIRIMEYLYIYYNVTAPSGYTALEFYETTGGYGVIALSTSLIHMLVLSEVASLKAGIATGGAVEHGVSEPVILLYLLLASAGCFTVGYIIGFALRRYVVHESIISQGAGG